MELKEKFQKLAKKWQKETAYLSSITQKGLHPAYLEIIDMGMAAVPLILRDLMQNGPNHWFYALREITGEDPVVEEHAGDIQAMADDWINWGKDRGLI
jgi:hypothetical protein